VVAEFARSHGKNNTRSIVERLSSSFAAGRYAFPLLLTGLLLQAVPGFASTIKDADNNSLTSGGKVHDIYTQQILSNDRVHFGYNRFKEFKISQGDIANMYFHLKGQPEIKSDNLVNLVKSKIDIQGTVNAIKDNRIGGNLYFLSPDGMVVGKTGVINAGRFVAMVPDSDNFTGKVGTSGMWGSTTQMAYQFEHYISNFGKRNDAGEFSVLRNEWAEQEELKGFKLASGGKIEIEGQVNTRSGMLLGAAQIDIKNGALLRGNKNIDFTSLANARDTAGNVITKATLSGVGLTAVADDKSGDVILRAATEHNNTFLYAPTVETIIKTTLDAKVDVDGTIETDGKADISASATHVFDSTKFTLTKPIMDIGKDLLRDLLGLNIDAAGARKYTTAEVNLKENGKIKTAGDVSLQADASTKIKLEASVRPAKANGTTSAMPVAAATVGIVKNKALVNVKGDITSTAGDIALKANANTSVELKTLALTPYTRYVADGDKGNAIYLGVSWLTGDNLAQIDIDEGKNVITAKGGDFSAKAHATSDLKAGSYVEGADKTFASTSVTVLDFDTATNVNIRRSVEAKSVKATADNEIAGMRVAAEDANGEGEKPYIDFVMINPETRGDKFANKLKEKYHWNGLVNGGKLAGLGNA
jgi:filamentous hemagglutinin family protein